MTFDSASRHEPDISPNDRRSPFLWAFRNGKADFYFHRYPQLEIATPLVEVPHSSSSDLFDALLDTEKRYAFPHSMYLPKRSARPFRQDVTSKYIKSSEKFIPTQSHSHTILLLQL